jgi:hypothetical protein
MTLDPFHAKLPRMKTWADVTKRPRGLQKFSNADAVFLCPVMREDERAEYAARSGQFDAEVVAAGIIASPGWKFTLVGADGMPIGCGGVEEIRPGVWQGWSISTPEAWATDWRRITKACRWVMDGLMAEGARRIQVSTLASRKATRQWYERSLRLQYEGTARQLGRNGQDIAHFARVREGGL